MIKLSLDIGESMVDIRIDGITLKGDLNIPAGAKKVILFAHGSGSSRHSPRNKFVADALNQSGLGTLLIDLLTEEEEVIDDKTQHLRFDITLLSDRLVMLIDWLQEHESSKGLEIGLFGASTGAAAALIAAAKRKSVVKAVVSRGGRPDLAKDFLPKVTAPTLLIVGSKDDVVIDLNVSAEKKLTCKKELTLVPDATHLFQEDGAIEEVARLASEWFTSH